MSKKRLIFPASAMYAINRPMNGVTVKTIAAGKMFTSENHISNVVVNHLRPAGLFAAVLAVLNPIGAERSCTAVIIGEQV